MKAKLQIINQVEPNGELLTTEMVCECMDIYSEQTAIAFSEWCDSEGYQQFKVGGVWKNIHDSHIPESQEFTTQELFNKFREENK